MKNRIRYNGIIASHPGSYIEDFLEDTGMSIEELSQKSDIDLETLNKFLNAEIEVNEEIAQKLETVTGFSVKMLFGFQELYYKELEQIELLKIKVNSKLFSTVIYILKQFKELSTMQLQKLTYYVQAWSLVFLGYPLFDENFQAWANGPVCPELYKFHAKKFSLSIEDMIDIEPPELNNNEKIIINAIIKRYGQMTGQELSNLTHSERPWLEARENTPIGEKSTAIISKDVMQDYYGAFSKTMNKYLSASFDEMFYIFSKIQNNIHFDIYEIYKNLSQPKNFKIKFEYKKNTY